MEEEQNNIPTIEEHKCEDCGYALTTHYCAKIGQYRCLNCGQNYYDADMTEETNTKQI